MFLNLIIIQTHSDFCLRVAISSVVLRTQRKLVGFGKAWLAQVTWEKFLHFQGKSDPVQQNLTPIKSFFAFRLSLFWSHFPTFNKIGECVRAISYLLGDYFALLLLNNYFLLSHFTFSNTPGHFLTQFPGRLLLNFKKYSWVLSYLL